MGKLSAVLLVVVLVGIRLYVIAQEEPGDTFQDQLQSVMDGCGWSGQSIDATKSCLAIVPEGMIFVIEEHPSTGSTADSLGVRILEQGKHEVEITNGRWNLLPDDWRDLFAT